MNDAKKYQLDMGLVAEAKLPAIQPREQLFGHITLVQVYGYAYPGYTGCYALVALRDEPGRTVAIMSPDTRLQTLFETALATGNLIYFTGHRLMSPPTPGGGTWSVDVYETANVAVYNFA